MIPKIGRIVLYKLSESDAQAIELRRRQTREWQAQNKIGFPLTGNTVYAGDVYPAMIVRIFNGDASYVNLRVFLDGEDFHWPTSRVEGEEQGQYQWPQINQG